MTHRAAIRTPRTAWRNRGYDDGFARHPKSSHVPDDCLREYLAGFKVGEGERVRHEHESSVTASDRGERTGAARSPVSSLSEVGQ